MSGPYAALEADMTRVDFAAIADAILVAYPDKDVLYALLLREWGVHVSDVIFTGQPGALAVAALVGWARSQGRALDLLAVTWSDRERECRPIQELARRWIAPPGIERPETGAPMADGPVALIPGVGDEAHARMKRSGQADSAVLPFVRGLCLVRVGERSAGTGFLIGRRTVLTTQSIMHGAAAAGVGGEDIRMTFEPAEDAAAVELTGAPGASWVGPSSEHAPSDVSGTPVGAEAERQLDFAVILLSGDAPPDRPVLTLPAQVPIVPPGDLVVIPNHPLGGAMTLTIGRLIAYSRAGARVTYEAETEPGSAGAPVFTLGGTLIALHHAKDIRDGRTISQGVPIWRIREAITAAGLALEAL